MDCNTDGCMGDDEGDEDATVFLGHLSSQGLSGTLTGLDSERIIMLRMNILRLVSDI